MSTSDTEVSAGPVNLARRGLPPRLGSLVAFAPLGVWSVWHLWENLSAFNGRADWEARVASARSPLGEALVSTVILVPLLLHTVWGLRRLRIMRPNLSRYPNYENLKFVLQRLSAIGLLCFLPAHLWLARLAPLIQLHRHESFADIAWHMRFHPPTLIVYILGILGTAYHLANGFATAGMTWGFAASPSAMRRMNLVSALLFVVLLAMGLGTVYALWSHGAAFANLPASEHG